MNGRGGKQERVRGGTPPKMRPWAELGMLRKRFSAYTAGGYRGGVGTGRARAQIRVTRLVGQVLMVLGLVAGITAMHTAIDMPMASGHAATSTATDPVAMHSSGTDMVVETSLSSPVATVTGVAPSGTLMGAMAHDAMHACLFLVVAVALLVPFLLAFGARLPFGAPRLAPRRQQAFAVSGIDRTLALQVLRI